MKFRDELLWLFRSPSQFWRNSMAGDWLVWWRARKVHRRLGRPLTDDERREIVWEVINRP